MKKVFQNVHVIKKNVGGTSRFCFSKGKKSIFNAFFEWDLRFLIFLKKIEKYTISENELVLRSMG